MDVLLTWFIFYFVQESKNTRRIFLAITLFKQRRGSCTSAVRRARGALHVGAHHGRADHGLRNRAELRPRRLDRGSVDEHLGVPPERLLQVRAPGVDDRADHTPVLHKRGRCWSTGCAAGCASSFQPSPHVEPKL